MRVLLLGAVPPPYGGVQVNLMAIRDFLRRRGDTCFAINLTRNRRPDEDGLFFPNSAFEVLRLLWSLNADVTHLHVGGDFTSRLLALGALCSSLPWTKTVLTFHSGGFASSPEGKRFLSSGIKCFLLRRFHQLIAVNDQIREFFVKAGVPADRVHVISPHSSVQPHQGELPARLETFLQAHQPLLMTIGLLEPEYDLPLQIELIGEVLADYPKAGLLIIGSGSMQSELESLISSKPWHHHILLYGDLAHSMTLAALQRSDVFLRTTLFDGDALSVREALELGVPVVATKTVLRPPGVRLTAVGDRAGIRAETISALKDGRKSPVSPGGETNLARVADVYDRALARS